MEKINFENQLNGFESLYMGIGIHTGDYMASYIGSKSHLEYTVIGNTINVASRIESFTMRGQILISSETYGYCRDLVNVGPPIKIHAKGKTKTLTMYEIFSIESPVFREVIRRTNRRQPRIDTDLKISFQLVSGKKITRSLHEGKVVNLGYKGMRIISEVKLEEFGEIKFKIALSIFSPESTETYAKVVYVREHEAKFIAGLEFTIMDDLTSNSIHKWIDELI